MLREAVFTGFIPVRDVAVAKRFYDRTLGLRVVEETPFALVLDANGTMLRLTPVPEFVAQPFTIAGWLVPDIVTVARALAGKGVEFTRYDGIAQDELGVWTSPNGDCVAWFKDPDGYALADRPVRDVVTVRELDLQRTGEAVGSSGWLVLG